MERIGSREVPSRELTGRERRTVELHRMTKPQVVAIAKQTRTPNGIFDTVYDTIAGGAKGEVIYHLARFENPADPEPFPEWKAVVEVV